MCSWNRSFVAQGTNSNVIVRLTQGALQYQRDVYIVTMGPWGVDHRQPRIIGQLGQRLERTQPVWILANFMAH